MADFLIAYNKFIRPNEGGYSNVSADKGGETYAGISRNYHPEWTGWSIIDTKKSRYPNGIIPRNEFFPDLDFLVERFYRDMWDKNKFVQIQNQDVANLLFDYYVNSGSSAIKAIQRLVNVSADGVMGPVTIAAINAANSSELHDALKKQRAEFYESLIARDPTQEVFRSGWFARLAKFPTLTAPSLALLIGITAAFGLIFFLMPKKETKNVKVSTR